MTSVTLYQHADWERFFAFSCVGTGIEPFDENPVFKEKRSSPQLQPRTNGKATARAVLTQEAGQPRPLLLCGA